MLLVGPAPGISPYSVVPTTDAARPCQTAKPLCRKPWFSAYHKSLVRQETWTEGLERYWTIARAISTEAKSDRRLTRLLLSVTLWESKWRRDIHLGIGKFSLGDGGRSWSIVQARLGRGSRAGHRLTGTSLVATKRAVAWGATHLRRCAKRTRSAVGAFSCYGGVSNGASHPGIQDRAKSFDDFGAKPPKLTKAVRLALGLPERDPGHKAK